MSAAQEVQIPYFDPVLEELKSANPDTEYLSVFGRHAHWGYWSDPGKADGSTADFVRAADEFTRLHLWAAGLRDGMKMLDVGCGFGGTIGYVNERYSNMDLTGVNIDRRQLERAREVVQSAARPGNAIRFEFADAVSLPFESASFDVITAVECIFHFSSREQFMAEAFRALKPGGRLVVSDYVTRRIAAPLLSAAMKLRRKHVTEQSGPMSAPTTAADYRRLGNRLGFSVLPFGDVTMQTLPSSDVFGRLLRSKGKYGEELAAGFEQQRQLCRLGILDYLLMTFEKPRR